MSHKIRTSKPEDEPQIRELIQAYTAEAHPLADQWAIENYLDIVLRSNVEVAEVDGRIVGAIAWNYGYDFWSDKKRVNKIGWYVLPEFRGRIGLALLRSIEIPDYETMLMLPHNLQPPKGYEPVEILYKKTNV